MLCGRDPCLRVMMCNMEWYVYVGEESGTDIYIYTHVRTHISLIPSPGQLSVACSKEKQERAWDILSHEWGEPGNEAIR